MPGSALIRRLFPWVVAVAIAGYVIRVVSFEEAWSALLRARLEIIAPLVLGTVSCWFLIDSRAYAYVFSRFNTPVSWPEARSLRGVTYLLTPIHLSLGKAGLVLRLHTLKKVSLLEGTSSVALVQTIDAFVLASLTALGLIFIPTTPETSVARTVALAVLFALIAYLALLRSDRPRSRLLDRVRHLTLHHAHRRIQLRDACVLVCAKLAYHLVSVVCFYFATQAFGIDIPFTLALAVTPTIEAIGGLPITPGGLGTQQAAMVFFFGGYGSEAAIVAFGFSLPIAFMAVRSLIGLAYLRDLTANAELESSHSDGAKRLESLSVR
jgi:uncharacterized membrane protein YbhN (UPF0104 family)